MKWLFTLLTCVLALSSSAQNNGSINGTAKDQQNLPLPGATVSLFAGNDTIVNAQKITKANGRFEFAGLVMGQYRFSISSMGFKRYVSGNLLIDSAHANISLPAVILQLEKNISLTEVVIKAKRPLLVQDVDKTIVHVDAMIGSSTSNSFEIMEKIPGIMIGQNADISLNGKPGVLVLIDGRATYMSAQDLAAYLKSLPGNLLDKIELMDNPPSKYEASGSAIINIRLKRNRVAGFAGNISAGYSRGKYARHNETANLSYNYGAINLFGNFSYNDEENYNRDEYQRNFYTSNKLLTSSAGLYNVQVTNSRNTSARIGLDFFATSKSTFGIIFNVGGGARNGSMEYSSQSFNNLGLFDSSGKGEVLARDPRRNTGVNLNYLHWFNDKGRELAVDINYLDYRSSGYQRLKNASYLANGLPGNTSNFLYELPSDINVYNAKADYTHPLPGNAGLEAGLKINVVSNDNNSQYFSTAGGINKPDYTRSNHFLYFENINAAYFNGKKNWKRLGIQTGIRVENTNITGKQAGNALSRGSKFEKHYTDIFPTAFVSYKLDSAGANTLTMSIARRIGRPNYQYLNPFIMFRDNYSYTSGNSQLNPQYQYQSQLKYQHKQWLGLSMQYGQYTNLIFQTTQAINNIFITSPQNVSSGYMAIFNVNISMNPAKWWNTNLNANFVHLELNGTAYTEKLDPSANTFRGNIINQFTFKKGWSAELSGNFNGRDIQGQSIVRARYRIYAAAQKRFWNDRASLRLSLDDIFHSWTQDDYAVSIRQAESVHYFETDSRRAGIAFTYRFGKDNSKRKSKHLDNAAEAEKGRIE